MAFELSLKLLLNKLKYGRYLDVFVSHSAPLHIQDEKDYAHRGVAAFTGSSTSLSPGCTCTGISTSITPCSLGKPNMGKP